MSVASPFVLVISGAVVVLVGSIHVIDGLSCIGIAALFGLFELGYIHVREKY